ncbi:hypothetical protein F0562_011189 [Nyssa sinensis]|uniref:Partial AB-hydrolase lipase domain-containing protein n=1 Tax=Nyssa sinensis TaxID=561372 RepID=A0A5J5A3X9_9ASTE|nr:hypothetical protein F0562_011189 [Nyssa sinensis]
MMFLASIILGGGAGTRLFPLTSQRTKPTVLIGGCYRLIEVPMSNCINSGIRKIFILTQFNSFSLNRHLARTYNFGNDMNFSDGFVEVLAATQTPGEAGKRWFQGTADAVRQFIWVFEMDDGICKSMVETQGYVCEEHTVTTQDGYILSVQRIPVGRSGKKPDKPPVLLQHGLMVDANTWLMNSPEGSLAFILADSGFDVWLSNTRGTNYSRGHTSLSANDPAYWEWSWDELVNYDLPASFQYVYSQTGQKLHYVGHSLGTLIALAAFSQEKLLNMSRSAALLSPIAYMGQMPALLARYSAQTFSAESLYLSGVRELSPTGGGAAQLLGAICNGPGINCDDLLTATTGANCCLDPSAVASFLAHGPQSTATKNIIHLAQMIRQGTIAMYDYGNVVENSIHYRQPIPPVYDMSRIPKDLPLFLSYGGRDILSDVNDVQTLLRSLANHDADKLVAQYIEDYAHVDFILGANAKQVVYDPLMAFFNLH